MSSERPGTPTHGGLNREYGCTCAIREFGIGEAEIEYDQSCPVHGE